MNYNEGHLYNKENFYNSSTISKFVSIGESFGIFENDPIVSARLLKNDILSIVDSYLIETLFKFEESFSLKDAIDVFALISYLESLNIKDSDIDLKVIYQKEESLNLNDAITELLVMLEEEEDFILTDKASLHAFYNHADELHMKDASKLLYVLISNYDTIFLSDKNPRKALSDFVIGVLDNLDNAYEWIMPFDMKIDWRNSFIQTMPQTESNYIDMPGKDGSLVDDTTYKNRNFSFVAFSKLGLSVYEKEQLKNDIVQILDSTKNNPKKMTFQRSGTAFDVFYSGAAEITEGPSYVKAVLPFETSPYGYPLFEQEVKGSGLLVNNGDLEAGCIHTISSGCVNPQFRLGSITYRWSGTVPANTSLVINHDSYSCYLETNNGVRTNVIDKLTGEFQLIPKHTSLVITASSNTEKYLFTVLKEKILWGDF